MFAFGTKLETLTVIAYYQPATRSYVEQIRGVDSSYSVGALLNKHLIEECGRLNVPGRPILYRTTPDFLRTFGLSSLEELPEMNPIQLEEFKQQAEEEKAAKKKKKEKALNILYLRMLRGTFIIINYTVRIIVCPMAIKV